MEVHTIVLLYYRIGTIPTLHLIDDILKPFPLETLERNNQKLPFQTIFTSISDTIN